jgi:hypothetical protein
LLNLQPADSGLYHVTAHNRAGLLSSDTAVSVVSADTLPLLAGPLTNQNNGNEYYLLNQSTWIEAEAWAQTLGGHLATVRNNAEQEWIFTTFGMWDGQARNLWIGLHDPDPVNNATNSLERRSEFSWVNGEPFTYSNWSIGEPNNYRGWGEYYVHTLSASPSTVAGTWNDTWNTNFNQGPLYGVVEVVGSGVVGSTRTVAGHFEFDVSGSPGDVYYIQGSTNLIDWQSIGTVTNFTGIAKYVDSTPSNLSQRFFRLFLP